MFQSTQTDEYLQMCIHRARHEYLTWVEQALDLIEQHQRPPGNGAQYRKSINDIGCNLGQFWKGLIRRETLREWTYTGYDVEDAYLRAAKEVFPELSTRLRQLDIAREIPSEADISVASAVVEHLDNFVSGLENILRSSHEMVILRTFLGDATILARRTQKGAVKSYPVNQYSFSEVLGLFNSVGFATKVVRDNYTDSMPVFLDSADGAALVRTQYVVVGTRPWEGDGNESVPERGPVPPIGI